MAESLTLVVNPGSASRKYAVFGNGYNWANISFEFVNGHVFGKIDHAGQSFSRDYDDTTLENVSHYVLPLLYERRVIDESDNFVVIGVRIVAPGDDFAVDSLITPDYEVELSEKGKLVPLHVGTALAEIGRLREAFLGVPIVAVSDTSFHATKPEWAQYYGIDTELADTLEVKRYGYHGISVGSIVRRLEQSKQLKPKTVICHLGSGSSVSAILNGKSIDNTMGYTPLEGLLMASRSGSIDISAALAIKHELQLSDEGLEQYLNKECGLIGVSGSSNDIRKLLENEEAGDKKSGLALQMMVYRIQQAVGQMAASLGGVDSLVFTGTVGERSMIIRDRILNNLAYLGFHFDKATNYQTYEPKLVVNISSYHSKPIYVISTDEAAEIARRAEQFIDL